MSMLRGTLLLAAALVWTVFTQADAQEARKYSYSNVVTIVGVDGKNEVVVKDGVRGQRRIRVDETTRIQDARGETIPLEGLRAWDRAVVDGRPEQPEQEGGPLVVDRIQLVIGSPDEHRSDELQRRDAAVRERVLERLAASRSLQGSELWVFAHDGRVTLRGLVADEAAKQRAIEIARRTPGVRNVTSELRSDPGVAEWMRLQVRDDVLAREVAERLIARAFPEARLEEDWLFGWEVDGAGFSIDVDADMGTVTLSGFVPSAVDEERAIRIARLTPGVRSVRSVLTRD